MYREGCFYFVGMPSSDFVRQLTLVISLWEQEKCFPVKFLPLPGFQDLTPEVVTSLDKQALLPPEQLLIEIGPVGCLAILGFRKTTGSVQRAFPSCQELLNGFNRPHTVWTEEEKAAKPKIKPSILSVGARALCKHAHRGQESFWGQATGSESQKNEHAC